MTKKKKPYCIIDSLKIDYNQLKSRKKISCKLLKKNCKLVIRANCWE